MSFYSPSNTFCDPIEIGVSSPSRSFAITILGRSPSRYDRHASSYFLSIWLLLPLLVMYKLSSQITYALRSHAADLAEEEDRLLADVGTKQVEDRESDEGEVQQQVRELQASEEQTVPVDVSSPVKRGRGRPRKNVDTPVKTDNNTEVPVFTVEPPSTRATQTTPAKRTRTALAPVPVASPAANTRSRIRMPTSTPEPLDDSDQDMITIVSPVKRAAKTIRKTRSSSKLAE
jgi:hypothetical protein